MKLGLRKAPYVGNKSVGDFSLEGVDGAHIGLFILIGIYITYCTYSLSPRPLVSPTLCCKFSVPTFKGKATKPGFKELLLFRINVEVSR